MRARTKRDAVRILFVIKAAGEPVVRGAPDGMRLVVSAEKRLQALDFWMRNPDYLAWEILNQHAADPARGDLLAAAEAVMTGDEPDLRRLPMQRFLFGAWEALDDAIATLRLPGLVEMRRRYDKNLTKVTRTEYFLTEAGARHADELATVEPLDWYAQRAALVAAVAGTRTGHELKNSQYKVAAYNKAKHGTLIAPIDGATRQRLAKARAES